MHRGSAAAGDQPADSELVPCGTVTSSLVNGLFAKVGAGCSDDAPGLEGLFFATDPAGRVDLIGLGAVGDDPSPG